MSKQKQRRMMDSFRAEKQAIDWNERYPEGTLVIVSLDDGSTVSTKTRSLAWVVGGHAVVLVEGITACSSGWNR